MQKDMQTWERNQKRGKMLTGFFILLAGTLLLLREVGFDIPYWIFSWKTLLIAFGLVGALKNGFSRMFWIFPLGVGIAFHLADFLPNDFNRNLIWPVILMFLGLFIILKPRRKGPRGPAYWQKKWQEKGQTHFSQGGEKCLDDNEKIEMNAVFGGIKKSIISKDLKGGEVNAVLGGVELNLLEADFKDQVSLEVNAVMGGVKLIVPSHWEIRSEINCVFGGVDDGRNIEPLGEGEKKVLLLEGNAFLGGIEIKNF